MTDAEEADRDDSVRAAEYALHLMSSDDRAAFERRLEVEGALRAEVAWWSEAFADLAGDVAAETPPSRIRRALEKATQPAPKAATRRRGGLGFLGRLAVVLGAAAAVAAVVLVLNRDAIFGLSPATLIAQMESDETGFVVLAGYHPDEAALVVNRSAGEPPLGRVLELWLIAPGSDAPVSLGVLPDEPSVTLTVPEPLRGILAGATLAISDEPPGGSPTGAPTGNVLAAGPLADV